MPRKLTQRAIAHALGLAESNVSKLKKAGMPVQTIEAAMAWRNANLDPARRREVPLRPAARLSEPELVAFVHALARAWEAAPINFREAAPINFLLECVREAIICIDDDSDAWEDVLLPMELWLALVGDRLDRPAGDE